MNHIDGRNLSSHHMKQEKISFSHPLSPLPITSRYLLDVTVTDLQLVHQTEGFVNWS
jgi:hypothetical protein